MTPRQNMPPQMMSPAVLSPEGATERGDLVLYSAAQDRGLGRVSGGDHRRLSLPWSSLSQQSLAACAPPEDGLSREQEGETVQGRSIIASAVSAGHAPQEDFWRP